MSKLELFVPKTVFFAGDEVTGRILLTCKKKTECKSFEVVVKGILTVSGRGLTLTGKARPTTEIATETFEIFDEEILIVEETVFDPGTQQFDFVFKLPEDAEISYDGQNYSMDYTVSALMDVSWRTKPKASKTITVIQSVDEYPGEVTKAAAEHDGMDILEVEIDTEKYCIGNKIAFRYRVSTEMEFTSLRARIEHTERSKLEGKMDLSHEEVLWEEKIFGFDVVRHEWREWTLNVNKEFPPSIENSYIQSDILLKVTIVRSLRFDKSAEITLVSGHCLEAIESDAEEEEVEVAVSEERPRPKRLRCETCSYTFKLREDDTTFGICPSCGRQIHF